MVYKLAPVFQISIDEGARTVVCSDTQDVVPLFTGSPFLNLVG
jgi:hypothetical protein